VHVPQLSEAPQPSGGEPQLALSALHVVGVHGLQVTDTLFTSAVTVPLPSITVQVAAVGDDGFAEIVTLYVDPAGSGVGNAKAPLVVTKRVAPPLCNPRASSCGSPATVPPTVKVPAPQLTTTEVTVVLAVPLPALTVHDWPAGWVLTVTAYPAPLTTGVVKLNAPLAVRVRLSPPLSWSTSAPPAWSPVMVPPTAKVFDEH